MLEKLVCPNNMNLTLTYDGNRDLIATMVYKRSATTVSERAYSYDALRRVLTRSVARNGGVQNDVFSYNNRSELVSATVAEKSFSYAFDEIGNRATASEAETTTNYATNALNQYSAVGDFVPSYDADGNVVRVKTSTGTWVISYNGENRPVRFENEETGTVIECGYDFRGRRFSKKVSVSGTVSLNQRYVYREFLQIACEDLLRDAQPALWFVLWDPTETVTTRPLAIQKDGTWFTFGWDITKNVWELFGSAGYIRTTYSYEPFGNVSMNASGVVQPFRFSSEFYDEELDLVYYNYRHYSPALGRFLSRDPIEEQGGLNLYAFVGNDSTNSHDGLGLWTRSLNNRCERMLSVAKTDEQVKEISLEISTSGCSLPDIRCECCGGKERSANGYYTRPYGLFGLRGNVITICSNNLKKDEMERMKRTVAHEMLHALQFCKKGETRSCRDSICREIAAHYQATQRHMQNHFAVRELVRKGVISSVRNFCKNISEEAQNALFYEQYEKCKRHR